MSTEVKPQKPWAKRPADRVRELSIVLAAVAFSFAFVAATELKGKLAYALIFFIAYGLLTSTFAFIKRGAPAAKDAFVSTLVSLGAVLTVLPMMSILFTVISKGLPGLHFGLLTSDMSMATPTDPIATGGILHAVTGTLTLVALALIMSVPIGILTALYLTEVKGRFSGPIRFLVQAMSGVPSIVAGLFILSAVLYTITKDYSALMGSLALTILMIPTIARTSEEVLLLIPNDLREAGTALGGTQWRTVAMIVLPAARSGLMTAVILGVARIAGETAPILLLTGGGDKVNPNPFNGSVGSLPFYIWKSFNAGSPEAITRAWAGLLVLMVLVLLLFMGARSLSSRKISK
ncbi:MAG: phosphate ABC transporter permease PstA [Candidatus Planktophila sp.]|jgi:phosphate transport system permease protein|nr:phosphate ABC transporter permease PstA [Candidatus Planktophila sp.]